MDNEESEKSRYEVLGFKPQKEIVYNKILPYADKLDEESLKLWTDIKTNLSRAVLLREIRPGYILWTSRLNKYIKLYGLKFSKEDHICLIKLMFELITIPDLEPTRVSKFANTLLYLLKKIDLLSPDDLELPWRPLYDLYKKFFINCNSSLGMYRYLSSLENNLESLIHTARVYFPPNSTQEMLDEWRPSLCPFNNEEMYNTIELFELFLPLVVHPSKASITYELWFNEFMSLWEVCHNAPTWELGMMCLMARLASYNIGYINWEPHIPLMFTRFLRSMDLPVSYRQKQSPKRHKFEITSIATWIASTIGGGSSTLKYLEKFMQTVESYYHPANSGRWTLKLRDLFRKVIFYFIQRLHKERYKKLTWETPVPDSHKLTEEDIDYFVAIMKPIVVQVIYSRQGTNEVSHAIQHLATIRPNIIVPLVLDKVYATLDSLTEPHKMIASLQCLVAVARPMLQGPKNNYPEGPTHVIPLLTALLPGIDPNDIRKCFVTFQLVSTFLLMIPVIDSSSAKDYYQDLTDEEHAICESTASLEDFILQFFERLFSLIENSAMEATRLEQVDQEKKSRIESFAENALSSICSIIAAQTSPEIFKSILRKLYTFCSEHILETVISGRMLAIMCRAFVRAKPIDALHVFVPHFCNRINELLGEGDDIQKEERLDNELLYNLCILSQILDCYGSALLPYIDSLVVILDRTLHLSCSQGNKMSVHMLDIILNSLTVIHPMEDHSIAKMYFRPLNEYLSIREWGKASNINKLELKWYMAGDKEIECVQMLINRYLLPELQCLEAYIDGSVNLTRDELRRSLRIILAILGAQTVLPMWNEPAVQIVPSKLDPWSFEMIIGTTHRVTMPDGSNVRKTIVNVLHRLQKKILACTEDDIKSLFELIAIWDMLLLNKFRLRDFEAHWKSFHIMKRLMEDRLRGNKNHLRQVLVGRVMLHQEFRMESRVCTFTETHRQIIVDLYTLSVSHYSEVRKRAQKKLFNVVATFPYAYTVLTPYLKRSLQVDTKINHEEFKGCLYVLLGPKCTPIITRHDWYFVNEIWPTLLRSQPSEKPSVIALINNIMEVVHRNFPTITINVNMPDDCLNVVKLLAKSRPYLPDNFSVTETEINDGIEILKKITEKNRTTYNEILQSFLSAMKENIHWRYYIMAMSFIRDLVHPDVNYNEELCHHIVQSLLHDNLEVRKLAIRCTGFILKQQKRPHKKVLVDPFSFSSNNNNNNNNNNVKVTIVKTTTLAPGYRPDNIWVQYNSETRPLNALEWNKTRFIHNAYHGYYTWPKELYLYAPYNEQPSVDRDRSQIQSGPELVIYDFFNDINNIQRLIGYLAMEEKKGRDKFNAHRFLMFKHLFRNYGDVHLKLFTPHLEKFVVSREEHQQRAAAEIIAAVIQGSKHWPFEKTESLWQTVVPLLRSAFANMTVETIGDWGVCCATASENRDPNRYHWLYELLMDNPLSSDEASFIECGRLYALQGILNQQIWRVNELKERLYKYLCNYLTHSFQNVRERVSSVLGSIFETDIRFPNAVTEMGDNSEISKRINYGPTIAQFIAEILPKLDILYTVDVREFTHCKQEQKPQQQQQEEQEKNNSQHMENVVNMLANTKLNLNQNVDAKERHVAIRLFKTTCRWIINSISRANFGAVSEYYQLFPLACLLQCQQTYEGDEELTNVCSSLLAILAQAFTLPKHVPNVLLAIESVANCKSWSARAVCAEFIQVFIFHNMPVVCNHTEWIEQIRNIVLKLLDDEKPEVRIQASQVLSGLLHCHFIPASEELLNTFKRKANTRLKVKSVKSDTTTDDMQRRAIAVRARHSGVLGMCAFINAHPYDIPDYLPNVFLQLGAHLNDPQPIPTTIRKTLGDFKRTHHDNWEVHQLRFTEDELAVLSDLTIPPSYYA